MLMELKRATQLEIVKKDVSVHNLTKDVAQIEAIGEKVFILLTPHRGTLDTMDVNWNSSCLHILCTFSRMLVLASE